MTQAPEASTALRDRVRGGWNRKPMWPLITLGIALTGALAYALRWNRRQNA